MCFECDPYCETCSGGLNTNCLICGTGFEAVEGNCAVCGDNCLKCTYDSPDTCVQCETKYFLFGDNCFDSCAAGYFATFNEDSVAICDSCDTGCLQCLNESNFCSECDSGFIYFQN